MKLRGERLYLEGIKKCVPPIVKPHITLTATSNNISGIYVGAQAFSKMLDFYSVDPEVQAASEPFARYCFSSVLVRAEMGSSHLIVLVVHRFIHICLQYCDSVGMDTLLCRLDNDATILLASLCLTGQQEGIILNLGQ